MGNGNQNSSLCIAQLGQSLHVSTFAQLHAHWQYNDSHGMQAKTGIPLITELNASALV